LIELKMGDDAFDRWFAIAYGCLVATYMLNWHLATTRAWNWLATMLLDTPSPTGGSRAGDRSGGTSGASGQADQRTQRRHQA
jgi:hypothetical protein